MYSNVTKDWSTSFSSIVSYKNILNISHMLYQLYYLFISFNLHNSFMKYLLFLLYDTCKIGLANWSWPKVKGKVSGGTRTKKRPPDVGLITLGLNILCPSWFPVYLSPLICVLEADPGNQHFQVFLANGLQWVEPNKWDQKREGRNVNEKVCLPYQQTKRAVPSGHQPLPTLISALRRNLSVVGVGNASHCSVLTRKIPWREERGGLQFMASHRVAYDWECMTDPTDSGILGPQTLAHSCESTKSNH